MSTAPVPAAPLKPTNHHDSVRSSSISNSISKRILWKEAREIAPMLAIFVVILGLILTVLQTNIVYRPYYQNHSGNADWYSIIWGFICMFALVVGMSSFSTEKENKTIQLLRSLPITSGFLVWTKVWIGLIAVFGFAAIGVGYQAIEIFVLNRPIDFAPSTHLSTIEWVVLAAVVIIIPIECFFWGAICSLKSQRTIYAAIAAVACLLFVSWFVPLILSSFFPSDGSIFGRGNKPFSRSAISFGTSLALLKMITYLLMGVVFVRWGKSWLGNSPQLSTINPYSNTSTVSGNIAPTHSPLLSRGLANEYRIYKSLTWQTFRQNRTLLMWTGLAASIFFLVCIFGFQDRQAVDMLLVITFPTALLGLLAFLPDHQNRNYRFFQQHVEHGRKLWFCRLLPAAFYGIASVGIYSTVVWIVAASSNDSNWALYAWELIQTAVLVTISGFAIGQFSSMLNRSGVFAFGTLIVLIGLLSTWLSCVARLEGNLWLFYFPIPAALVFITWWRAPAWLADKNRYRDYAVTYVALALAAFCTIGGFGYYRLAEAPNYAFGLNEFEASYEALQDPSTQSPAGFRQKLLLDASDAAVIQPETLSAFESLNRSSVNLFQRSTIEDLEKLVANNEYSLSLLDEADQLPDDVQAAKANEQPLTIHNPKSALARRDHVNKIGLLTTAQAQLAEKNGDLEQALESWLLLWKIENEYPAYEKFDAPLDLIRWSELPNQNEKLIKKAIKGLEGSNGQWRQITERYAESLHLDLLNWVEESKQGKIASTQGLGFEIEQNYIPILLNGWETKRSIRMGRKELSELAGEFGAAGSKYGDHPKSYTRQVLATQPNSSFSYHPVERISVKRKDSWGTLKALQKIQSIRYAQIRLALNAWRVAHDAYPRTLEQLVPEYLDEIPVDVMSGHQFAYSPIGLHLPAAWNLPAPKLVIDGTDYGPTVYDEPPALIKNTTEAGTKLGKDSRDELIRTMNETLKSQGLKVIAIEEPNSKKPQFDMDTKAVTDELEMVTMQDSETKTKPTAKAKPKTQPKTTTGLGSTRLEETPRPVTVGQLPSWAIPAQTPFLLPWSPPLALKQREIKYLVGEKETWLFCLDFSRTNNQLELPKVSYTLKPAKSEKK
ncbi:MAG: ABC transporter permease [Mariniblastus sp.]